MYNQKEKNHHSKASIIRERKKALDSIKNLVERKNYAKALSELNKYLEVNSTDMFGHFLHGRILMACGDLKQAKQVFTKVFESTSTNRYSALIALGDIAKLEGNIETAKDCYYQAITNSPYNEKYAIITLARLESKEEHYDKALKLLERLDPNSIETKIEQARSYTAKGEHDKAYEILETCINQTNDENRLLALEKGKIARNAKDIPTAKFNYLKAKESSKKDDIYYKTLMEEAKLYLDLGDFNNASSCCQELLSSNIEYQGEVYLRLATAQEGLKQFDQALINYRLATTSQDPDIRSLAYYNMGSLQFAKGEYSSAKRSLINSITPKKTPNSTHIKLIAIMLKEKRYDEAYSYLQQVMPENPTKDDFCLLHAKLLLDKIKGNPLPTRASKNYTERQIIEYREDDALDHIINHHQLIIEEVGNFAKQIDIPTLFTDIKYQLTEENMVNEDIADIYEVDYPNAGYDLDGTLVHKIRVVCLPTTKNILTMYPSSKSKTPRLGDFKKIPQETSKTSDQIAKFNKKFKNYVPPKC